MASDATAILHIVRMFGLLSSKAAGTADSYRCSAAPAEAHRPLRRPIILAQVGPEHYCPDPSGSRIRSPEFLATKAAMVPLTALWLPILLSGVIVFFVSAAVWMVMPHHKNDFAPAADQDTLMDAVRSSTPGPGMYYFPWVTDGDQNSPEYREKARVGPVGILRVRDPQSVLNMGPAMLKSVVLYLVVSVFIAYLASVTLAGGAPYLSVFQVTGTAAFMAYGFIGYQEAIWFGLPAPVAFKHSLDGLVYALLTAGIFGWLWPA